MTMLFDIGANLTNQRFDKDRDAVIQTAKDCGVGRIAVTGSDFESNEKAQDLVAQYPQILIATAGCHPHHASDWNQAYQDQITTLIGNKAIHAVGECGLDYNRDFSPRDVQRNVFAQQLQMAVQARLPVFLHQRDAHQDFAAIMSEYENELFAACVHCFTDEQSALESYIEKGFYIGITGWICDERRGQALQSLVKLIPDEQLLIETDAPYLAPRDIRPKPKSSRNEPKWLGHIAQTIAKHRQQSLEHIATITTENANRYFGC